ncbi:DUF6643 family protein [Streptomyces sp. V4-01]|uniref:DUF6643 family protein n=1 Tax=Actinacidiphila polyblastidii TaxID=3110430 RepID=A0ABU7PGN0_9ACTN|nr:DUF6643 family protein [Streptomyces sp. V4-01]
MTTPRGSYGGGYGGHPSSASFPDTPIYDSLVAERGTPQIAPIRVPSPYSAYESTGYNSFGGGSNLPALPALPALPSGPSAQTHQPQYQQPQPQAHPQQGGYQNGGGYQSGGYQQPAPTPYIPQQTTAPRGGYNGYGNGAGYPAQAPQPSPSGYEAARPVPPRPMPPRQAPGGHPEDQYPRRNLGQGYYQG